MRDVSFVDDLDDDAKGPGQTHNRKLLNSKCGPLIRSFPH
jgi:hypothetical protein